MPLTYRQLGPEGVREHMSRSQADPYEIERRVEYARRALILKGRYGPLVYQRIAQLYQRDDSREQLQKFTEAGTNVLARVVRELAFVYSRPPIRRLLLRDSPNSTALNERFAATLKATDITAKAKQWGRYAFGLNVVWVLPGVWQRATGLELEYQLILPDTAERITSDDPKYTDLLLWPRGPRNELGQVPRGWHAVDGEAYLWLDERFELERYVFHGLGRQPATELRVSDPPPDDYWDIGRGAQLAESTIECGRIAAAMGWVRLSQNRRLVTLLGDTGGIDREQVATPDGVLIGKTSAGGNAVRLDVHDFVTSIDEFKREIRYHIEQAVESYGVPITVVDPEPASTGDAVNVFAPAGPQLHAAQTELREDQIEYARKFELQLAVTTHELAARHRLPNSVAPEIVAEALDVRWQPLTFVDQPLNRITLYERKIALGLMSHADAWNEEYGGNITDEEAFERVLLNLGLKAAVDLFYARHNLGLDARVLDPRVLSVPQMQGRAGGLAAAQQGPPQWMISPSNNS